jgi:hypothetical protein
MKSIESLIAASHENFDLTSRSDQARLNGEDSLRTKLSQLDWTTPGTGVDWHLYAVDDGDPMHSGDIARDMIRDHPLEHRVTVLHLADALRAISDGVDAVIYTDADNSVHLGQIGLLLGLKVSVRKHGLPHNEEMARVLDEEIESAADLDILIHHLPPELQEATVAELGDPAIMHPAAVRTWIRQRKLQTA